MPIERSVGAVIFTQRHFPEKSLRQKQHIQNGAGFRRKDNEILYLLLHYPDSPKAKKPRSRVNSLRGREYWGFPKGHIEKGETIEETAKREVQEETGLTDINFADGFREKEKYFFTKSGRKIFKIVIFLLAETKTKEIKISFEHTGFQWLPYEQALDKLTFKNAKRILKKANQFLELHLIKT